MSNINPYNIDGTFPVAGQDNSSQGFRDNFTNTKNNFISAKSEIEDLQNNAILKSALSGTTLDNDMAGAQIKNASIIGFRDTVKPHGVLSGSTQISFADGHYHTATTMGTLTVTAITNWPASGIHAKFRLALTTSVTGAILVIPPSVNIGNDTIIGAVENKTGSVLNYTTITFPEIGTYIFEFSTSNGGTNVTVTELTRNRNSVVVASNPPASASDSGITGQITWDEDYVYVCTATNTWVRAALSTW